MSRFKRPNRDLNQLEIRLLFHSLKTQSASFKNWTRSELNALADQVLPLTFAASDHLARRGEPVEWLGIICEGTAQQSSNNLEFGVLNKGDFIGYMKVLDMEENRLHKFDITAVSKGSIGLIFLEDFKAFPKKNPRLAFKLFEQLAVLSMNSMSYQYSFSLPLKPSLLTPDEIAQGDLFTLLNLHTDIRNLILENLERSEVRVFLSICNVMKYAPDQPIVQKGYPEDTFFGVLRGELYEKQDYESKFIATGTLFGLDHFINPGRLWPHSIHGFDEGLLLMIRRDAFTDIIQSSPVLSIKIYKLLFQLYLISFTFNKTPKVYLPKMTGNYIELDTKKARSLIRQRRPSQEISDSEEIVNSLSSNYPPLFLFYKHIEPTPPKKETKGPLSFVDEKLHKQRIEARKARKNRNSNTKMRSPKPRTRAQLSAEEEINAISNQHAKIRSEHEEMRLEIQRLKEENAKLKRNINQEELIRENLDIRLKKIQVFKELLGQKYVEREFNINMTFKDTTLEHVDTSKEFYLAQKYVKKWKKYIQKYSRSYL